MNNLKRKRVQHYPIKIMGCGFVITAIDENKQLAWDAIRAAEIEMRRIEALISSWTTTSQTYLINEAAGKKGVVVSKELFELIERSLKVSELSNGAFDISGTLSRYYWNFNKKENEFLAEDKVLELRSLIDFQKIKLEASTSSVYLEQEGMKIGFGGIGKGYAALKAKEVMESYGIESGLVNASGDLLCWGSPPDKDQWEIKIPDPTNRTENLLSISFEEGSVVTSGSYENFTLINGIKYSHIINPRTALPVTHTKNVTVICPNVEFADAFATALSVLPINEGLSLCNKLAGVECIIIDVNDVAHFSLNLKTQAYA